MEVILLEHIDKLGFLGDVVDVKNGYARNFLLPQKKALRKTKANLALFEEKKKEYEAYNLKLKEDAKKISEKLKGLSVIVVRQAAENGQLYGSVTARDICMAAEDAGFKIERSKVDLKQPYKNIGIFDVNVVLHPEVVQSVQVVIARSNEDAKALKKEHKAEQAKKESAEQQKKESADK